MTTYCRNPGVVKQKRISTIYYIDRIKDKTTQETTSLRQKLSAKHDENQDG